MNSPRKLVLFSGYVLTAASLLPFAPLGGCGGDDSGAAGDSGADSPFATLPDTGSRADVSSNADTGGGGGPDGSGPADTGVAQGGDAAGEDSGVLAPSGAIAIWHFDEASGVTANDSSGNGHTATLVEGATFAPGKRGTGLSPNTTGWALVPAPRIVVVDSGAGGNDASGGTDASDASDAGITDAGGSDAGEDAGSFDADVSDAASDTGGSDAGATDSGASDDGGGDGSTFGPDSGVDSGVDPGLDSGVDAGDDAGETNDASLGPAPLSFDTTKSFSIGCWVKVYSQGPGQWESIFGRSGKNLSVFTLKLRGDNPAPAGGEDFDFDFPGADDTGTGTYTVAQSTTSPTVSAVNSATSYWYHLVGVLDVQPAASGGTTVALYVNGASQASVAPGANAILEAAGDTLIGASLFGSIGASFNGVIDEVYLYDRALSATEVSTLYQATR